MPSNRTGRRKPHTTTCTASFRAQTKSTKCSLQARIVGSEGKRTTKRSLLVCDLAKMIRLTTSVLSPQNILWTALSVFIFLFHLIVAFSHVHFCPYVELAISQEFLGCVSHRLTSLHCMLGALAHFRSASQCHAAKAQAPPCTVSHVATCRPIDFTLSASARTDLAHDFSLCDAFLHPAQEVLRTKSCP